MTGYKAVCEAGLRDETFVKPADLPMDNNSLADQSYWPVYCLFISFHALVLFFL